MLVVVAFHRLFSDTQWWADLLHTLAVFLAAGLFISVLFAAQLLLVHQIERGYFSRRRQSPRN